MNDRELLELAAKAAGLTPDGSCGKGILAIDAERMARPFDPINDDGDALRLAVKLHIDVTMYPASQEVGAVQWVHNSVCGGIKYRCFEKYYSGEPYAATRRAIVRAAAEIGKQS